MKKFFVLTLIAVFVAGLALPALADEHGTAAFGETVQTESTEASPTTEAAQSGAAGDPALENAPAQTPDSDQDSDNDEDASGEDEDDEAASDEDEPSKADEAKDASDEDESDKADEAKDGSGEDEDENTNQDKSAEEDADEELLEEYAGDSEDILELEGNDLAQAIKAAIKVLEAKPEDPIALAIVARGEAAAGNLDRALELARQLKASQPDSALAVALEADALIGQGKLDEALALLQASPAINEDDDLLEALADIHEKKGKLDEAVQALEKALAVTEEQQNEVYDKLKHVFQKLGDNSLKIYVEGKKPLFDVEPQVIEGRTLVPFRALAETLGATVTWDPATSAVSITKGDSIVKFVIGTSKAEVNGVTVVLAIPAQVIEGRTMVPLRFVGEALNAEVTFDPETGMIIIKQVAPANTPAAQ